MPRPSKTPTHLTINARAVPLVTRVNRRAKRLILKVDPISGEIFVTAPTQSALGDAVNFARDNAHWIEKQLKPEMRARPFRENDIAMLRGEPHRIVRDGGPRRPVEIINDANATPTLKVGGDSAHLNRRVVDWMKRQARADFSTQVEAHCAAMDRPAAKFNIRDARTRWGSCSSDGVLNFTWRLIMAPAFVLDYVAAHECAHLLHMNHGPAFWREVTRLGVEARQAENWLSENGTKLFTYGAHA